MSIILNGRNQYAEAISGVTFGAGRYLAGWVRTAEFSNGIAVGYRGDPDDPNDVEYLSCGSSAGGLYFNDVQAFPNASSSGATADPPGVRDVWVHVGVFRQESLGGASALTITVNGVKYLDGGNYDYDSVMDVLRFGRNHLNNYFEGELAFWAEWDGLPTDQQLEDIATFGTDPATVGCPDHVWTFESLDGNGKFPDSEGSLHLTPYGSPTIGRQPWGDYTDVAENGMDICVQRGGLLTGSAGLSITANGSPVSIASVLRTAVNTLRLRIVNSAGPILKLQTVLLNYTPGDLEVDGTPISGFSNAAVENGSEQKSDSIYQYGIRLNFSSPTGSWRGIYADGSWAMTLTPTSQIPLTEGSGTGRRNGAMLNPVSIRLYDNGARRGFDGRANHYYSDSVSVAPGVSMSAGDALVASRSLPESADWEDNEAYAEGDVIRVNQPGPPSGAEHLVYYVCTSAGTSGGTEPTWNSAARRIWDNTVRWARYGKSATPTVAVFTKVASLPAQTDFRPAFSGGEADKTVYSTNSIRKYLLPGFAAPSSAPTVEATQRKVERPWVEVVTDWTHQDDHHILNSQGYGQAVAHEVGDVLGLLMTDTPFMDELLIRTIQRGIDFKGMRESGGDWTWNGGHGHGRWPLIAFAGVMLGRASEFINVIRGDGGASPWGFNEFNETKYITSSDVLSGRYTTAQQCWLPLSGISGTPSGTITGQSSGASGTVFRYDGSAPSPSVSVLGVAGAPYSASETVIWSGGSATVGAHPTNVRETHPATVQQNWLHVPEWSFDWDVSPNVDNKSWEAGQDVPYRFCCTAVSWVAEVAFMHVFGLENSIGHPALSDYYVRYRYVKPTLHGEGWNGEDAFHLALWYLYADSSPLSCTAFVEEDGGHLRLAFSRYATMDPADTGIVFTGGSVALSEWEQVAPREWRAKISGNHWGETLRYELGTQPVVDSGNNELPSFSEMRITRPYRWEDASRPFGPTRLFGGR